MVKMREKYLRIYEINRQGQSIRKISISSDLVQIRLKMHNILDLLRQIDGIPHTYGNNGIRECNQKC